MKTGPPAAEEEIARYADMFAAMGTEPRLRILRLLLSAHPAGLVVGDIQAGIEIPNSTLSHHLDKLKNEELVTSSGKGRFSATWRTRKRCATCWASCMPSAARGAKPSSREPSCNSTANRRFYEHA